MGAQAGCAVTMGPRMFVLQNGWRSTVGLGEDPIFGGGELSYAKVIISCKFSWPS